MRISHASKEYIKVEVTAREGGVIINPTVDAVGMAFVAAGVEPASFTTGSWEVDNASGHTRYYARVLVGPGGLVLTNGNYVVWVKITDAPEVPVKEAGVLTVY